MLMHLHTQTNTNHAVCFIPTRDKSMITAEDLALFANSCHSLPCPLLCSASPQTEQKPHDSAQSVSILTFSFSLVSSWPSLHPWVNTH
uniref:Uncharacterized protein n=1 Tax=Stegastes partitus TaxID=144197 RepID=A0A3B5A6B3_9TELE